MGLGFCRIRMNNCLISQSTYSLPLMSSGTVPGHPSPPSSPISLRLLLVEDHEPTLRVLARLLVRDGHQVVPARTVAEALEAAETNLFDVLVSDLGLPDGTGCGLM